MPTHKSPVTINPTIVPHGMAIPIKEVAVPLWSSENHRLAIKLIALSSMGTDNIYIRGPNNIGQNMLKLKANERIQHPMICNRAAK